MLQDIALALSLLQPWDAELDKAVCRFRQALVASGHPRDDLEEDM